MVKATEVGRTSKMAEYLEKQINALQGHKSQRDIAREAGYTKPNIISMFKKGETKVPINKIPQLAKALEVDPAFMFRLAMEQYWPDVGETIAQIFKTVLTRNELEIIEAIREASNGSDPKMSDSDREQIAAIFHSK